MARDSHSSAIGIPDAAVTFASRHKPRGRQATGTINRK
jgi:hypothetical protein